MITYHFDKDQMRAIATNEEGKEIGESRIVIQDGVWVADHTFVDPSARGQNVAHELVKTLMAAVREAGQKVRPTCSYVVKEMDRRPEYADLRYQPD